MDPRPFAERLLCDDSLTDGLADEEAKALLEEALARIEREVEPLRDGAEADRRARAVTGTARRIAQLVERICYGDPEDANRIRRERGRPPIPEDWMSLDPLSLVRRLCETEFEAHA